MKHDITRIVITAASIVALRLLSVPGTSAAATIVGGTVVNASQTFRPPVAGVPVMVIVRRAGRLLTTAHGRTDNNGHFAVLVPPLPGGASYAVVAIYRKVSYEVPVINSRSHAAITVPVYDTTGSDARLAAMSVIIDVRHFGHGIAVLEQWKFVNLGGSTDPRTDVGTDPTTGRNAAVFPLPPGATHATVLSVGPAPATADVVSHAVVVNTIIRPATGMQAASFHDVTFTYDLPTAAGADHPTLLVPTRYFIGALKVVAVGARLVAQGFTQTILTVGPQQVPAVKAVAVAPGSILSIGIDGPPAAIPATAVVAPFPNTSVLVISEIGFGALLFLGLYVRPHMGAARRFRALQRERECLIKTIALLDVRYAQRAIDETTYQQRRTEEKRHLLTVVSRLGEIERCM